MTITAEPTANEEYEISDPSCLQIEPIVSVMMLSYNHGPYLAKAIEGVLTQQTDFAFELLIGDDCSVDDSLEIAVRYQRQYPQMIRVLSAKSNVGAWKNNRRLLKAGRGSFLAHHDGDDYWLPGKLKRQVTFLRENPNCTAIYTNAVTVTEVGDRIGLFNDVGNERFELAEILRKGNFFNNSSMLFRASLREALLEIEGPFIDFRAHLRHARHGFLMHLAEPLTAYRVNSAGSAVANAKEQLRQCYWEAIMDVPRNRITDDDFAHGIADFLRRIVFRTMRTMRWSLLRHWAPQVFAVSPYGKIRTSCLVVESIFRTAWIEAIGRLRRAPGGGRLRVLYRR